MSFNLARVVVDAQIEYCDAVKEKLAVYGKALDLTPSFNGILVIKAFVIRTATMNSSPKHHTTMRSDHNSAKKSLIKLSNAKQVSEHETHEWRLACTL